jgi:membrane protein implicated in regulation of membrane protease activity
MLNRCRAQPRGHEAVVSMIWFVVAAALVALEVVTLAFAAGLMAAAAAAAGVVAVVGGGLEAQAAAFALTSLLSLAIVVPLARRRGLAGTSYPSGAQALLDRPAVVLTQVDAESGTVRIGGEVWSARAYDETLVLPQGTQVSVFEIVGATALVYPREFS